MYRDDYLELVDWTGRVIRDDKKGAIPEHIAPILERLNIQTALWLQVVLQFDRYFYSYAGSLQRLQFAAHRLGKSWLKGGMAAKLLYQPSSA